MGELVGIGDTRLFVEARGDGFPLLVLHGGPGLDHHMFGDYLDPLGDRYRLLFVDQRANGRSDKASTDTWTLPQMAADVSLLARALRLDRYAVLGHSYGALVALQHAVDHPGHAAASIISGGVPAARFFEETQRNLETFEPVELRKQVADSWAREIEVRTQEEAAELIHDQLPFHFADPFDPRIEEYERRSAGAVYAPDVLRHFAAQQYGGIDVEDLLDEVTEPVLVISGRHERTCVVEGAELMAKGLTNAELLILENSAHMTFVEEQGPYLDAVRGFMDRVAG